MVLSGRIAGSTFPAARPSITMSPAAIRVPPMSVSSLAQRVGTTASGGVVPQHLLQRVRQRHLAAREVPAEARVGQDQPQRVRDQIRRGLQRADQEQPQVLADLLLAQALGMGHQPAGHVLAGVLLAAPHQLLHGADHQVVAGQRGRTAADHVGDGLSHGQGVGLGYAELLADHEGRQLPREVGDEVRAALPREVVDQLGGVADDVPAHPVLVDASQTVRHRLAQPGVLRAVRQRHQRLPGRDGPQGRVRGEGAVLDGVPVAGVGGELVRTPAVLG
ncbi:hypothetical protein ACWGHU_06780 [Streptomyces xanthophaeus]